MKKVEIENEREFRISFYGGNFKETLDFIKGIEGRSFRAKERYWVVPITAENIKALKAHQFTFDEEAQQVAFGDRGGSPYEFEKRTIPLIDIDKTVLNKDLRPYQIEAIQQLCGLNGRGILSFPPGCGKTAVVCSYFQVRLEETPLLVICPAFMKIHWKRELMRWGGLGAYICEGRKPYRPPVKYPIWIINYEILSYWQNMIEEHNFKSIVCDESQKIANSEAQCTESVLYLSRSTEHFIAVSGTPIKNRPREFYTTLHVIDPRMFKSEYRFLYRFCGPHVNYGRWVFDGATHIDELHDLVSNYMIRKEKEELLPELPQKLRTIIPMALKNRTKYENAEKEIEELLEHNKNKEAHDKLMELSNTAFPLKKDSVLAWIDDWLAENSEESIVIMAYHHAVIDYLKEYYEDSFVIDGRVPSEKRQSIVDKFQEGRRRILIGQIQAAGIGFTMTKANTMAIVEVCYVPGDLEQAEDRLHRIGQTAELVEIYYLVGEGTIEDAMLDKVERKVHNLSRILDGKKARFFEES